MQSLNSLKLTVIDRDSQPLQILKPRRYPLIIGRNGTCNIQIQSPKVSREHCFIDRLNDGQYFLSDNQSVNGTFVNGIRVSRPKLIVAGDVIKIGPMRFIAQFYHSPKKSDNDVIFNDLDETHFDDTRETDIPCEDIIREEKDFLNDSRLWLKEAFDSTGSFQVVSSSHHVNFVD